VAQFKNPYNLAMKASERIARQMAAVIDNIAKATYLTGTNAIFCGTGNTNTAGVAAGDVILSSDIKKAVALLETDSVERLSGNAYVGIIHPFAKFDVELDDDAGGWIDAARYAGSDQLFTGELGKYAGVRFVVTSNAGVFEGDGTSGIDVYSTTIVGKGAIAVGDLSTQEIIVDHGGGASDPLRQQMTVGWKAWLGACLVGEGTGSANMGAPRYIRIESAASLG
jgi:N4-gp56 family major capsid protein